MKFRVRCQILLGLVALLQFGCGWGKRPEKEQALVLQTKVENLIEKILRVIQEYYHQIRTELKCIPDDVPDTIIGTLKKSIDCVDQNERDYDNGRVTPNAHKKTFLKCFSDAKTEVEKTIASINPKLDYCPENMTEKTYQINVTTTFTKTFHINIKNGLEVMKKEVHLDNQKQICVFNHGEKLPDQVNQTGDGDGPESNSVDEDHNYDAGQSKGKDVHSKEHDGKDFEPKEHHGKGREPKEHHGKGREPKEHNNQGFGSKEHHGKGREPKEHHGKGREPKEHHGKGREPKEHHGKGPKPKGHHGKGHHPKEQLGSGHESEEQLGSGHESEEQLGSGHESEEQLGSGHESEEQLGSGHESKEMGLNVNLGSAHGGSDSWNEDEFAYPDQQVSDQEDEDADYGGNESDVGDDPYFKEHPDNGNASKEDYSAEAVDDNDDDYELSNADGFGDDSVDDGYDEDEEKDLAMSLGSEDDDDEESQTEEHQAAGVDSKELHDKGDESEESLGSAQQPAGNDDDDDREAEDDKYFPIKGRPNGNVDDVAHHVEMKNNTKDKNLSSAFRPVVDDGRDDEYDDSGIDDEKVFFPETSAKAKTTTRPPVKLATELATLATEKTSHGGDYADMDEELEDSKYGKEYDDAEENEENLSHTLSPAKALDHVEKELGQMNPIGPVKQRIQIKPRNQFKQKPKKLQQNSERHKIKLPKLPPGKAQQETSPIHQAATSLAQSFLQSDF